MGTNSCLSLFFLSPPTLLYCKQYFNIRKHIYICLKTLSFEEFKKKKKKQPWHQLPSKGSSWHAQECGSRDTVSRLPGWARLSPRVRESFFKYLSHCSFTASLWDFGKMQPRRAMNARKSSISTPNSTASKLPLKGHTALYNLALPCSEIPALLRDCLVSCADVFLRMSPLGL